MIFCEYCFKDEEISSMIHSTPSSTTGVCPICGHKNAHLYDTDLQHNLTPYFEDLLNIYTPSNLLPDTYPRAETHSLIDDLKERWNIFGDISRTQIYEILKSICSEFYTTSPYIFEGTVGIPELYDSTYLKDHALLKNNDWDAFVTKNIAPLSAKLIRLENYFIELEFLIKMGILKMKCLHLLLVKAQKGEQMLAVSHVST